MYGQKQILQCLAVAIILAVFSFHRNAIKRNREVMKSKIIRKYETNKKIQQINAKENSNENHLVIGNFSGYCIRYPFGRNMYGNHDIDIMCPHICFDKFDTWLQKKCQANCCVIKKTTTTTTTTAINALKPDTNMTATNGSQRTRIDENALMKYVSGNSASLYNKQQQQQKQHPSEPEKTIFEPITENLMNMKHIHRVQEEYECKIQTDADQAICKNTTSVTVDFVKLETINNTKSVIMEYHDFLFDMGQPEPKAGSTQSIDRKDYYKLFLFFFAKLDCAY